MSRLHFDITLPKMCSDPTREATETENGLRIRDAYGNRGSRLTLKQLVTFLTHLLPHSLPLLRRIQLGTSTESSCVISSGLDHEKVSASPGDVAREARARIAESPAVDPSDVWTIAFVHRDGHPATEIWWFSSLELRHKSASHEEATQPDRVKAEASELSLGEAVCDRAKHQLAEVLRHVPIESRQPGVDIIQQTKTPQSPGCLAGYVHNTTSALLKQAGLIVWESPPYGLYTYPLCPTQERLEPPDGSSEGLPDGLIWSNIGPSDFEDVMAVNKIVRSAATIAKLPSVAVREAEPREDGRPGKAIAFVFAGGDGAMRTLHVDEGYRRKGLANRVARRLMGMGVLHPPTEGPFAADPSAYQTFEQPALMATSCIENGNTASMRTFQALGATRRWDVYWIYLDLDRARHLATCADHA